jgi:hypothetical protein
LLGAAAIVVFSVYLMQATPNINEALEDGNAFSTTAILSGRKHRNAYETFVGGEANAVMGGVELDFRDSSMQGEQATIDLFVMMGGVDLRIPQNWVVVNDLDLLMGGVDDKTRPASAAKANRLLLRGTVVMGGVNIRN